MFFRCITADMAAILRNPFLRELPPQTYLAGGTAVALHLGHRLSIDLDFFTPNDLDSLQWFKGLQTAFSGKFTLTAVKIEKNTLVVTMNSTGFSLLSILMNSWRRLSRMIPCRRYMAGNEMIF